MKTTRQPVNTSTLRPFSLPSFAALLAAALLAGCATRMAPDEKAYVYIAENNAITFDGETFTQTDELPRRLIAAGATPENQIVIIPQGEVPPAYLRSLVSVCGHGGLPNVLIRDKAEPLVFTQQRGTGVARPSGTKPPRFVAPGHRKDADNDLDPAQMKGWKKK